MLKDVFYPAVFMHMALLMLAILMAPSAFATSVTYTVNSDVDLPDSLTIPGTCHTAINTCTLRAAVMQANRTSAPINSVTIVVPPVSIIWAPRR